ncbi:MAG: 50S ribosomal protein L25 [Elusimicrobiota bacterium]
MEEIRLEIELRAEKSTKGSLSEMRRNRKLPAVVYGGQDGSLPITIGEKALMGALKAAGANAILRLKHGKGEETVILKELQRHVVSGAPIHADFQRIDMSQKVEVDVPLHTFGEAPGVKLQGGVLEHTVRELHIRCLPNAIPQQIEIDVSALEMGSSVLVRDLNIPEGIEVLDDAEQVVVNIVHVREEEPEPTEEAVAVEGEAEPEVIAKGKKEEEPAEGGEAEAPGAKKDVKKDAKKEGGK